MLDPYARKLVNPLLNLAGRFLVAHSVSANAMTFAGLLTGIFASLCVGFGVPLLGLLFVMINRIADGLDGAIARASDKTDFGGYLDICADFLFYCAIPAGFVFADPAKNGAVGAFLLVAICFNGVSFLGFAILAEKNHLIDQDQDSKVMYYSNGILGGSETIIFFVLICLLPVHFTTLSFLFGALCFATAILRIAEARRTFTSL